MKLTEFLKRLETSNAPVIVDLWAPWCVPCRTTKPILEALATEYAGQVEFLAINADDSGEVVEHYRVLGIPTVLSFQEGQLVRRITGAQNEANYRRIFEAALQGEVPQLQLARFDRILRLGAGVLLIGAALLTDTWTLALLGGFLGFLGLYDRCPLWKAIRGKLSTR
jgi:thioredoxin 1